MIYPLIVLKHTSYYSLPSFAKLLDNLVYILDALCKIGVPAQPRQLSLENIHSALRGVLAEVAVVRSGSTWIYLLRHIMRSV